MNLSWCIDELTQAMQRHLCTCSQALPDRDLVCVAVWQICQQSSWAGFSCTCSHVQMFIWYVLLMSAQSCFQNVSVLWACHHPAVFPSALIECAEHRLELNDVSSITKVFVLLLQNSISVHFLHPQFVFVSRHLGLPSIFAGSHRTVTLSAAHNAALDVTSALL